MTYLLRCARERVALWLAPWLKPDPPPQQELSPEARAAWLAIQEQLAGRRPTGGTIKVKTRSADRLGMQ